MKINLVLAPEQSVSELLALQTANPDNVFYLGKVSQLAGSNILILDAPEIVQQFQRPLGFDSRYTNGQLTGRVIHQIAFQAKDDNDKLIGKLVNVAGVVAQNDNGKADYMLWTFWQNHSQLADFLKSTQYQQMINLMKNPYTTTYQRVTSDSQLSLKHQMRDVDPEWWG
ncbi:hypothetical protein [Leuconostoc pseudomesenteroides]|uniref:Uncharacterized protein n=1 Tax=Leuconostoc pseudomesenteroides TaxID=33968 RepID=A0A5B8SXE5_LEUPS|nr:hypothetical protein [Leuconostoc pseudomesenteroides]MCC8438809.1 hypothetical protein [Leuconostoc pseudomesenteroides]MDG9732662.1 hypothetical protein [Leuconostoc pseudomesenteroides]NKZ35463.1 hypothetical protein [Leuconostoc pseudomesenteroides]QEA41862.1 hypothetical protein FGL85_04840 [Leuconostoc pseudomesenteroides]QQB27903.1 hypothetical protein I6H60_02580 [Leuconostoc pseudomesenteroides]